MGDRVAAFPDPPPPWREPGVTGRSAGASACERDRRGGQSHDGGRGRGHTGHELSEGRRSVLSDEDLFKEAEVFEIDLETKTVTTPDGVEHSFEFDEGRREKLLKGLDDIALTLQSDGDISAFEAQRKLATPWLETAS